MELNTANLLDYLAEFACNLKYEDLPEEVVREAKRRIFDSLGCLIMGARHDEAVKLVRHGMAGKEWQTQLVNGFAISMDGSYSLENAAYLNTHSIRALDWNDTYLSLEPAHPSDNIGAILALAGVCSGKELITASVLAYDIQCRFCDAFSLRKEGWDHVGYLEISSALATGKIMRLDFKKMRHAASLALRFSFLRQIRAGNSLSNAKGLSAAEAVMLGVHSVLEASWGVTGPEEILEGECGFIKQCAGEQKFEVGAFENLGSDFKLFTTHIKFFPVEYHAQSAVWSALGLREMLGGGADTEKIKEIKIISSEAAKNIIGGEQKKEVKTKESADHSIFYITAVVLADGELTLKQYDPIRFSDPKIISLMDLMTIQESPNYSRAYCFKMAPEFGVTLVCRMRNGELCVSGEHVYPKGHFANPLSDKKLKNKFGEPMDWLDFVWSLEKLNAKDLYWILRDLKV